MDPYFPILLCLIAGLSTGIGSLIAILFKKMNMKILSFALGLSAGVMIYVSFVELLPEGFSDLGVLYGTLLFFGGILFILILDFLVPEQKNPHHITDQLRPEQIVSPENNNNLSQNNNGQNRKRFRFHGGNGNKNGNGNGNGKRNGNGNGKTIVPLSDKEKQIERMGILTAITIFLHNIPEGLITFMTATHDYDLGMIIAFAIAIHNIPEGISVAMPILYASKNKKKAFGYSFLSGFAEPIAAVLCALFLWPFLTDMIIGGMVVFTAGIMVYISLDEILPNAHRYCTNGDGHPGHTTGLGIIAGMFIMALSLILLS